MYELQKIEIGVEKVAFRCFYILPYEALPTDRWINYLYNRCLNMRGMCRKKIVVCFNYGLRKLLFYIIIFLPFISLTDILPDKIFIE